MNLQDIIPRTDISSIPNFDKLFCSQFFLLINVEDYVVEILVATPTLEAVREYLDQRHKNAIEARRTLIDLIKNDLKSELDSVPLDNGRGREDIIDKSWEQKKLNNEITEEFWRDGQFFHCKQFRILQWTGTYFQFVQDDKYLNHLKAIVLDDIPY